MEIKTTDGTGLKMASSKIREGGRAINTVKDKTQDAFSMADETRQRFSEPLEDAYNSNGSDDIKLDDELKQTLSHSEYKQFTELPKWTQDRIKRRFKRELEKRNRYREEESGETAERNTNTVTHKSSDSSSSSQGNYSSNEGYRTDLKQNVSRSVNKNTANRAGEKATVGGKNAAGEAGKLSVKTAEKTAVKTAQSTSKAVANTTQTVVKTTAKTAGTAAKAGASAGAAAGTFGISLAVQGVYEAGKAVVKATKATVNKISAEIAAQSQSQAMAKQQAKENAIKTETKNDEKDNKKGGNKSAGGSNIFLYVAIAGGICLVLVFMLMMSPFMLLSSISSDSVSSLENDISNLADITFNEAEDEDTSEERYIDWYLEQDESYLEDDLDSWNALFFYYCANLDGILDVMLTYDSFSLQYDAEELFQWFADSCEDAYTDDTDYEPASGDLIFLDIDDDSSVDYVAVVYLYDEESGEIYLTGGDMGDDDSDNGITTAYVNLGDERIAGYGIYENIAAYEDDETEEV